MDGKSSQQQGGGPFAVWGLIQSVVPPSELPLVRSHIGESLIEYCTDLRAELETILEIRESYLLAEYGENASQAQLRTTSRKNAIPDPPQMKEMLIQEIQLLLSELSKNEDKCLSDLSDKQNNLLSFFLTSGRPNSESARPSSGQGKPERPRSNYFSSPVKLKKVRENINAQNIEKVVTVLQNALQKECEALKIDIEYFQNNLDDEATASAETAAPPEPSITELRELRNSLQSRAFNRFDLDDRRAESSAAVLPSNHPPSPIPQGLMKLNLLEHTQPSDTSASLSASRRRSSQDTFIPDIVPRRAFSASLGERSRHAPDVLLVHAGDSMIQDSLVNECWVEPSWVEDMSTPLPMTPDSGVCSRPPTRDLSSIEGRLSRLEVAEDSFSVVPKPVASRSTPVHASRPKNHPFGSLEAADMKAAAVKKAVDKKVARPPPPKNQQTLTKTSTVSSTKFRKFRVKVGGASSKPSQKDVEKLIFPPQPPSARSPSRYFEQNERSLSA